jgi:hypothetical protein
MESIDAQATRSGTLRYRRLLALATLMSIITGLATIAALSTMWYAHVRTYKAEEIKDGGLVYIMNRTLVFWDLEYHTTTIELAKGSESRKLQYEPFAKSTSIVKVAQGFDLIALFVNAALFIFLISGFSRAIRTKVGILLGARLMRAIPILLTLAILGCLLISAIGFVGINHALDLDGSDCGCVDSFARFHSTIVGYSSVENPGTHTIESVKILREDDWGPQAGWFLTLLQVPFAFVLLYSVAFNKAPLPMDHYSLADPL